MTTKLEGIQERLIARAQAEYEVQLRDALNNFWKSVTPRGKAHQDRRAKVKLLADSTYDILIEVVMINVMSALKKHHADHIAKLVCQEFIEKIDALSDDVDELRSIV